MALSTLMSHPASSREAPVLHPIPSAGKGLWTPEGDAPSQQHSYWVLWRVFPLRSLCSQLDQLCLFHEGPSSPPTPSPPGLGQPLCPIPESLLALAVGFVSSKTFAACPVCPALELEPEVCEL